MSAKATSGRQYLLECHKLGVIMPTQSAASSSRNEGTAVIVSRIRVQYPAAGFRKREGREEEYAVGCYRKDRDGVRE